MSTKTQLSHPITRILMTLAIAMALTLVFPSASLAKGSSAASALISKTVSISYNINGWKKEKALCQGTDVAGILYTVIGQWDSYNKKWGPGSNRTRFLPWHSISSVTILKGK